MRRLWMVSVVLLMGAKGKKAPAEPAPEAVAPPPAAPVEAAPAEPEPPEVVSNVDLRLSLKTAAGATTKLHVTGLERTVDFSGDKGWTADADKLVFAVETGGTEIEAPWSAVASITIKPGKVPDDIDCSFRSDLDPVVYECTLRTTAAIALKDGRKGEVANRHRWRLTSDDGVTRELQVYKYALRATGGEEDDAASESDIYKRLIEQIKADAAGPLVLGVTVE